METPTHGSIGEPASRRGAPKARAGTRKQVAPAAAQPSLAKLSITIPQQAADAARERAGARGLSAYIAHAVEQQLRRDALLDWVDEIERRHGRIPDDEVARAREILLGEGE